MDRDNPPMPDRAKLETALKNAEFAKGNSTPGAIGRGLSDEDILELIEAAQWARHVIPDEMNFIDLTTRHPLNQVYFRAGLLACREYMARFVEQGGDMTTAQSIRANWWPRLGPDPGAPRLFNFDELARERPEGGWETLPIDISTEALPRAFQFLNGPQVNQPIHGGGK